MEFKDMIIISERVNFLLILKDYFSSPMKICHLGRDFVDVYELQLYYT